jgi:hypothetical protein
LVDVLFYADDGMITGEVANEVQHLLDLFTKKLAAVGLKMKAEQTESMIMEGGDVSQPILKEAYYHRITGEGKTWAEKAKEKLACELCGNIASRSNLIKHQQTKICLKNRKTFIPPAETEIIQAQIEARQPQSFTISVNKTNETKCPVSDCQYRTSQPKLMCRHFRNIHNADTIIISEEGPLPRCNICGLFQQSVGSGKKASAICLFY